VTANAVCCNRACSHILLDLGSVVVIVVVEVSSMALSAGTAGAAIDRGIAIAVDTNDAGTIGTGVAEEAGTLMYGCDCVTSMTVDAEWGAGNRSRVVMAMPMAIGVWVGEVVGAMATDTR